MAASIAHALSPNATVDSVLDIALKSAHESIIGELTRGLAIAERFSDALSMRDEFYKVYNGGGIAYAHSWANEVVTKAFAVFMVTKGNASDAIVGAVNFGRDTDCLAAVAGGLAGALSGVKALRPKWIEQVDEAARQNIYTNSQRTLKETADGLYEAVLARIQKAKKWVNALEQGA